MDLASVKVKDQPFPHFYSTSILQNIDSELFEWFENTKQWTLTETDFYEQYEFNLFSVDLPKNLQCLISEKTISRIKEEYKKAFGIKSLELVGIIAHKLVNDQHIGIHNDFINGEETHRLVIHINPFWNEENGGFLLLFNSAKVEAVSKVISPINNSAFGFEISKSSYHAVSKIYDFSRYTIVYTLKKI